MSAKISIPGGNGRMGKTLIKEIIENENLELPDLSNNLDDRPVIENGQYISF